MIKALLSLFIGQRSWIPMVVMTALLLVACAWIHVQGLRLDATRADAARKIQTEQFAHNATRAELATALAEASRWADVAKLAQAATASVRATAQAALAREDQARADSQARKQIMSVAKPRIRAATETMEVVDDATRQRAADRLNRSW